MTNRKDEHVKQALAQYHEAPTDFDDVHFVHYSLARHDLADIDLTTHLFGRDFPVPFFINAMTGGTEWTKTINQKLATVARETGLMMASGSVSAALRDPSVADTFSVIRETNPNGFIVANIGAERTLEDAKQALAILDADALEVHLNTPQEIVMPEGGRAFASLADHIDQFVHHLDVPVIVKEVGFGMSRELIRDLTGIGVSYFDVSGKGGTNFAAIENTRRPQHEMGYMAEWGQSTAISLLESGSVMAPHTTIASGGIKHPLHMAKAFALGAQAVGMSGQFLHQLETKGIDDTVQMVHDYEEQLKLIALALNAPTLADFTKKDVVITGYVAEWCERRHIPLDGYANRNNSER